MKREREEASKAPKWWDTAVQWILSSGGAVHSAVTVDDKSRELRIKEDIAKNEVLLEIPHQCLVSWKSVESTPIGRRLVNSVMAVEESDASFYNSAQDIAIALFLAASSEAAAQDGFCRPYLNTLPDRITYDNIPRRWQEHQLQQLLTGSCLIDRIRKARDGVTNDYKLVQTAWNDTENDDNGNHEMMFPSLTAFDDMLAAVTSRAFAGVGGTKDEDIAMVPLLDMCNHHRGDCVTKNVSYVRSSDCGSVHVTACQSLAAGSTLRITYGARGNSQLLFNYGFCIPNNIEPDGSSNDVIEFQLKPDSPPIELRSGPKSYTFGCFVKALELFHSKPEQTLGAGRDEEDMRDDGGDEDDMEAFLNEQEESDLFDSGDYENDDGDCDEEEPSEESAVNKELVALDALREALEHAQKGYSLNGNEIKKALATTEPSPRYYAAILISSEMRTIQLYLKAIGIIRKKLEHASQDQASSDNYTTDHTNGDDEVLRSQAADLAKAFLTIRYPSFPLEQALLNN